MRKIILASASPRRSELMKQAGLDFDVCVSTKEEKKGPWEPEEMVRRLSRQKAQDVAERYAEDCIIVGADTVVSCDQEILGKPANDQDAFRMLHMLQGRTHEVYTGVTVIEGSADVRKETVFAEKTEVTMYPMTDIKPVFTCSVNPDFIPFHIMDHPMLHGQPVLKMFR